MFGIISKSFTACNTATVQNIDNEQVSYLDVKMGTLVDKQEKVAFMYGITNSITDKGVM